MNVRALGALACVALSALACGYDYVDPRTAKEAAGPTLPEPSACRVGEAVEKAKPASTKELAATPDAFAKATVRVRGTLKSETGGGDRLVTQDGDLKLDLASLPPFWIDACPGHTVDVDGTIAGGDKALVLHAVAMIGVP